MKKKILIFSLVYYPRHIGGAEVALKEITDRLPASQYDFDMITLRLDKNLPTYERIGNVNVHRICFAGVQKVPSDSLPWYLHINKYVFPFAGFLKAQSLHRRQKYDGVWSMMANYSGFGALFFKICNPAVPFLLSLQEGDPIPYIKKRVRFVYPLFRRIFTRADYIQVISNYLADWAKDMGARCPVIVVPNGVDVEKFTTQNSVAACTEIRTALGIKEFDKILITTSRLVVKNAVADIIRAMQYLSDRTHFLVLGDGYQGRELKSLAERLHLTNRVHFLGYVGHSELPRYLHTADVFVRAPLSEGFGNSFVEAMAAGLPVIATPVGGIPDFLRDKETGLFCKVNNPKSIAETVLLLDDQPALRETIIAGALRMVREKYDWNIIAEKMCEIFNGLYSI